MNGIPLTYYQLRQLKFWSAIAAASLVVVFVIGNLIGMIVRDPVRVDNASYISKKGLPLFVSERDYINMIENYPYDPGTKLTVYQASPGESFWQIAIRHNVSVETIIAANPFLTSLVINKPVSLVIPSENGLLCAIDNIQDTALIKKRTKSDTLLGEYSHNLFSLFSLDDMRLLFVPGARPVVVNDSFAELFRLKGDFRNPIDGGYFSSLYGIRNDPFSSEAAFHNAIDIRAMSGTPIKPAAEGYVSFVGWHDGYGLSIEILHDGGYVTFYAHCLKSHVKAGDHVTPDMVIGEVGSTGLSTGPHLHFSLYRHNRNMNPIYFIW